MYTIWGEALDPSHVLQEYPRPQLVRASYVNLNGPWSYAIGKSEAFPDAFDGEILVPFSPESLLSGVNRMLLPDEFLWCRRTFTLPEAAAGAHTLLHFGAVDQCATVFINDVCTGSHTGGYLPFTIDVTGALAPAGVENTLMVRVADVTDAGSFSRGKQKTVRGGIWYTPQSGIWQTVWLEQTPKAYVSALKITPLYDRAAVEITVESDGAHACAVSLCGVDYPAAANAPVRIPMPDFIPWTPETPHLYPFSVTMGDDRVESYFAMRKFSVGTDGAGVKRLFLNNRPYFHNGVLDQGYWPDGLYTAPSDEAMIFDIRLMKDMGFNMLRKHIKVEPLRWYYHCDRLGMLVWQDMVNGGGAYRPWTVSAPLMLGNSHSDGDYAYFARTDARGRAQYLAELADMMRLLYNCPCVAMWVPFNEGWGQFDAVKTASLIKSLDGTRTVDHASGWHDQGAGDIQSLHVYFRPYRFRPDRLGRPVALTEFGGYGHRVAGHCFSKRTFGYKRFGSPAALLTAYCRLYESEILPARQKGLAAAVYTQLSDVEEETNGFVTYDRKVVKLPAEAVRRVNGLLCDQ